MNDGGRKMNSTVTAESEQVEQLLRVAQDELLLKLSVDSHMSRVAPDYLDSDLDRRFRALKSRPSAIQSPAAPKIQREENRRREVPVGNVDEELRGVLGDDLSARFATLKASLSSSSSASTTNTSNEVRIGSSGNTAGDFDAYHHFEEDEEDEVEKVIRWAKDAARLDPSPPSDDDDQDDSDDDNDDEDRKNKKGTKDSKK